MIKDTEKLIIKDGYLQPEPESQTCSFTNYLTDMCNIGREQNLHLKHIAEVLTKLEEKAK